MATKNRCPKCGGRDLHVGDRFTYSDSVRKKAFFSRWALEEGLQTVQISTGTCDVVVTEETEPYSDTLEHARRKGVAIIHIDDFERLLKDVCDEGAAPVWRNNRVPLICKKVLILGYEKRESAEDPEVSKVFDVVNARGFELGQHIRSSLGAAVIPSGMEHSGRAKLCQKRGVPIYRAADFARIYG